MHSPTRHQAQKGADSSAMELALHASDLLLSSTLLQEQVSQIQVPPAEPSSPQLPVDEAFPDPVPLMHFPHCRLDITTISTPTGSGKCEQVALPGALVRTLLSRFEGDFRQRKQRQQHLPSSPARQSQQHQQLQQSPAHSQIHRPRPGRDEGNRKGNKKQGTTASATRHSHPHPQPRAPQPRHNGHKAGCHPRIRIQPHIDDSDDWVFSRCLLADFTGFREDDAEFLSSQGRLCCWASVVLQKQQAHPRQRRQQSPAPPPPRGGQARQGPRQHKRCGDGEEEGEEGLHRDRSIGTPGGITNAACGGGHAGDLEVEDGGIPNNGGGVGDDDPCVGHYGRALEDEREGDEEEEDGEEAEAMWELKFIVQRVGVRDPRSGWCECF
ncbi:hypothetical protein VTH82DRAFT_3217 [Thermothelomyces myriococcoides]